MIDIHSKHPYPSGALSNFTAHAFVFRDVPCNSMEGLLQSLLYPNPEDQKKICLLTGKEAKLAGTSDEWEKTQTLWWQGKPLNRQGPDYQAFIDDAYAALFSQNEAARAALLSTEDQTLCHSIGEQIFHEDNFDGRRILFAANEHQVRS